MLNRNRWRIPTLLEEQVRARDKACVYCRVEMLQSAPRGSPRKTVATWEHIINDATIITQKTLRFVAQDVTQVKDKNVSC